MNNAKLSAKIIARNRANAAAISFYDAAAPIVARFLGQKIYKADGSLIAKLEKLLPKLAPGSYRFDSRYSLSFVMKEYENVKDAGYCNCIYQETYVHLGDVTNGILNKLYPRPDKLRSDYTFVEIAARRADAEAKEEAFREADSKLYPFGRYDN